MWVQNGDFNSRFFHNNARIHIHKNCIAHIIDGNGTVFTVELHIEHCFLTHNSNFWSEHSKQSIYDILHALPKDLKCISDVNKVSLIRLVSKAEVYKTLCSFPTGKSTEPDGLNAEFY